MHWNTKFLIEHCSDFFTAINQIVPNWNNHPELLKIRHIKAYQSGPASTIFFITTSDLYLYNQMQKHKDEKKSQTIHCVGRTGLFNYCGCNYPRRILKILLERSFNNHKRNLTLKTIIVISTWNYRKC